MSQSRPCSNNCGGNTKSADGICKPCKARRNAEKRALPCERCGEPRGFVDKKYCKECAKVILSELESSGYLQKKPSAGKFRDQSKRENTHETKFGTGH